MAVSNDKKGIVETIHKGLEETQYAFSDLIKSIIRLRGEAKSNQDGKAVERLIEFEVQAVLIKDKVAQMNTMFQPYLKPQLTAISNSLDAEFRRLQALKSTLVQAQKYEHVAKLHDIQKDIRQLQEQIITLL